MTNRTPLNMHTDSYVKWKAATQETFEFSVLVCSAVPTLKRNLVLFEKGIVTSLTKPDHYGPIGEPTMEQQNRQKEQLKERSKGYRSKLSKYILISNFSFFESYVTDAIYEMIDFHGGKDAFLEKSKLRCTRHFANDTSELEELRRKVRRPKWPKANGCKSASSQLKDMGYGFPSDLFSSYGANMLVQKVGNMKSVDIPKILMEGLHLEIDTSLVDDFHNVREMRNKIAHGEVVNLTIEQVTNMSKTLKNFTKAVDQHLLRYYFISQIHC